MAGAPLGELSQVSHQSLSLSPWPWQPGWTLGTPRPSPQPHQPASSSAEGGQVALAGSRLAGEAAPSLPLMEIPGQGWHCLAVWEGPQRQGPAGSPLFFLDSLLLGWSVLVFILQPPSGALSTQDFPSPCPPSCFPSCLTVCACFFPTVSPSLSGF